jgi:hypothetical protein
MIESELAAARSAAQASGKPARRFKEFRWSTLDSGSRERRVVAKAEWTQGEANPPFVVTSLSNEEADAPSLREGVLRARRHGEPDQGMSARSLGRPHFGRDHARQSAAAVVSLPRLRSPLRAAPRRPQAHAVRQGQLRNHSSQSSSRSARSCESRFAASSSPWPRLSPTSASTGSPTPGSPPRPADEPDSAQSS